MEFRRTNAILLPLLYLVDPVLNDLTLAQISLLLYTNQTEQLLLWCPKWNCGARRFLQTDVTTNSLYTMQSHLEWDESNACPALTYCNSISIEGQPRLNDWYIGAFIAFSTGIWESVPETNIHQALRMFLSIYQSAMPLDQFAIVNVRY